MLDSPLPSALVAGLISTQPSLTPRTRKRKKEKQDEDLLSVRQGKQREDAVEDDDEQGPEDFPAEDGIEQWSHCLVAENENILLPPLWSDDGR
jgi:hypothetical protein